MQGPYNNKTNQSYKQLIYIHISIMLMWHKPCRIFHPWCPCIKTRCLSPGDGRSYMTTHFNSFTLSDAYISIIGSDNGLSSGRCQAIIWTNAGIFLIWPLGTNFSEISIEIHTFLFNKMHLKRSSGKWQPFCLGLYVLSKTTVGTICAVYASSGCYILLPYIQ